MLLKLPPIPKRRPSGGSPAGREDQATAADVRASDGVHVSPVKVQAACAKLVHSALLKHGVGSDQVRVTGPPGDRSLSVQLPCGWRAELVPCVAAAVAAAAAAAPGADSGAADVYYVTR